MVTKNSASDKKTHESTQSGKASVHASKSTPQSYLFHLADVGREKKKAKALK